MERAMDMSRHAEARMAQRGVRKDVMALLLAEYDVVANVGGGCHALSLSHQRIRDLLDEGHPTSTVESLGRLVVVDGKAGTVVTVLHARGRRGRRYRRSAR
jgi:hypothetical protein